MPCNINQSVLQQWVGGNEKQQTPNISTSFFRPGKGQTEAFLLIWQRSNLFSTSLITVVTCTGNFSYFCSWLFLAN